RRGPAFDHSLTTAHVQKPTVAATSATCRLRVSVRCARKNARTARIRPATPVLVSVATPRVCRSRQSGGQADADPDTGDAPDRRAEQPGQPDAVVAPEGGHEPAEDGAPDGAEGDQRAAHGLDPRIGIYAPLVKRVRFAPSPTGTLHVGNALSAVANRRFGDWLLLRIDDTDPARNVEGGEEAILGDLEWLGIGWEEGPVRQSDRAERHLEAARAAGVDQRFDGVMLWRDDGSPTFHLASVVDDHDFGITHVIRGSDHRANEELHAALHRALGFEPPTVVHHGLVVGDDGRKLAKRADGATVASLRSAGYPAEAVRASLEALDLPRHDVHLDLDRIRSLSTDVLSGLDDAELAARAGVPVEAAPLLRGAHDLVEARELAAGVLEAPSPALTESVSPETLDRFVELRSPLPEVLDKEQSRQVLRELKAVGGNLRELRRALTGRDRGPELWAVLRALPRDEAIRRTHLT